MSSVTPVYGMGLFFVRETGLVEQVVVFDYHDPSEYYKSIAQSRDKLEDEKKLLARNMQSFLDAEEVKINSKPVYPGVLGVDVGFRGSYRHPYVVFFIVFLGEFRRGVNTYEDIYEPETAEYDYRVYWVFPSRAKVLKADLGVPFNLLYDSRVLSFAVSKGQITSGYERIEFELFS